MTKRIAKSGGFTLLEVLVALAVLAITFGALLPVFSGTLMRQAVISDQKAAVMLAQSKLDELGADVPLIDGSQSGEFGNGFKWRVEIAPYKSDRASELVIAKQVTLAIQWPASNGFRSLDVKTIRLVGRE